MKDPPTSVSPRSTRATRSTSHDRSDSSATKTSREATMKEPDSNNDLNVNQRSKRKIIKRVVDISEFITSKDEEREIAKAIRLSLKESSSPAIKSANINKTEQTTSRASTSTTNHESDKIKGKPTTSSSTAAEESKSRCRPKREAAQRASLITNLISMPFHEEMELKKAIQASLHETVRRDKERLSTATSTGTIPYPPSFKKPPPSICSTASSDRQSSVTSIVSRHHKKTSKPQRKFAQNSSNAFYHPGSSTTTPVKGHHRHHSQTPLKEVFPAISPRPHTDDFLTFLCFMDSPYDIPKSLDMVTLNNEALKNGKDRKKQETKSTPLKSVNQVNGDVRTSRSSERIPPSKSPNKEKKENEVAVKTIKTPSPEKKKYPVVDGKKSPDSKKAQKGQLSVSLEKSEKVEKVATKDKMILRKDIKKANQKPKEVKKNLTTKIPKKSEEPAKRTTRSASNHDLVQQSTQKTLSPKPKGSSTKPKSPLKTISDAKAKTFREKMLEIERRKRYDPSDDEDSLSSSSCQDDSSSCSEDDDDPKLNMAVVTRSVEYLKRMQASLTSRSTKISSSVVKSPPKGLTKSSATQHAKTLLQKAKRNLNRTLSDGQRTAKKKKF